MERCKRKQIVRRQIHLSKPSLGLFRSSGEYKKDNWKQFKKEYNITKASLNVLLSGPGEEYFNAAKLPCNRNKSIAELSPFANEFFRVFLTNKGRFVIPSGKASYRPYDSKNDILSDWSDDGWTKSVVEHLKLAVMDFRLIPGTFDQATSSKETPYFYEFLSVLGKKSDPHIMDPLVWLWICDNRNIESQIVHHIYH